MHNILLKDILPIERLTQMLGDLFKVPPNTIKELLEDTEPFQLVYQIERFEGNADFNSELTVFPHYDLRETPHAPVYPKDVPLAIAISHWLKEDTAIATGIDDPYVWILMRQDEIYLVDEDLKKGDVPGLNVDWATPKLLSYNEAMTMAWK